MRLFSRLRSLIRNLVHGAHVEKELDEEVRSYVEMLTDEKASQGLRLEEARRAAQIELGGIDQIKEKVRDVRSGAGLEELRQDLLYAQRSLVRNAAFTIAAILSLSIGIGSSAALFCIVKDIFIRPLPFSQPERLIRLTGFYPKGAVAVLQRQSTTMDVAAFSTDAEFNFTLKGKREHLRGSVVSSNLFSLLGTQAAVGRTFYPGEDLPGKNQVVVLSHALWEAGFGADPNIVGSWVSIEGLNRQIVGVMPGNFGFPSSASLLWIPLQMDPSNPEDYWGTGFMPVVARLRPDVSLELAQEEIRLLITHVITEFPYPMARNWNADGAAIPLRQDLVGNLRSHSQILLWAVCIVMLVACVNVTSLSLSRASARRKEICIRASLGATPKRIARQILSESLFLAFAGGGLGLLLVFKVIAMLQSALPRDTSRLLEVGIDWPVGLFVIALAIISGLVSGAVPAISFASLDLGELFKTYGSTLTWRIGNRFRNWLIAGEVTLAFILVISAGLLIRSLWRLTLVDPGFGSEHILTVQVFRERSSCLDRSACVADYNQLLRQARGISGVSGVAAANALPLSGKIPVLPVEVEGHPLNPIENLAPLFYAGAVTPEYFRMMRIPILEGRAFTDADRADTDQVVVVSSATARSFWPGQDPVNMHIRVVWDSQWRRVIGVVGDVRQYDLANKSPDGISGTIYMPYPQSVGLDRQLPAAMTVLVRTTAEPLQVENHIRGLVASLSPNTPVSEVGTMDMIVSASTSQSRSTTWFFVSLAGSTLLLAAIGIYGVVAYSMGQRTYEMGVRLALGATKKNIQSLVLRQILGPVLLGLAIGMAASLALTRMLASLLYGVTARDPITFSVVGVLVMGIAVLASYLPVRRAATVDPVMALRVE